MPPSDFMIGGQEYGFREAMQLRGEVLTMRNTAMILDKPNMHAAVLLSHVAALLFVLIKAKWPTQFELLAGSFERAGGRRPQKYGDITLDLEGVVSNMVAHEAPIEKAWDAFVAEQSADNLSRLNEGVLRMRLLLDIAHELLDEKKVTDDGGGHA